MSNQQRPTADDPHESRPAPTNPRLQMGPSMPGGGLLGGGPRLDVGRVEVEPAKPPAGPRGTAGPHIQIDRQAPSEPVEFDELGESGVPVAEVPELYPRVARPTLQPGDQLAAIGLKKSYRKGPLTIPVLRGVDLGVRRGELLAIVGQSGCGKSTLLHLLGTLDAPDAGEVQFDGQRIDNQPAARRDALRNKRFGMIFQFYHLLPELNTLENVLAPLMIRYGAWSYFKARRRHRAVATEMIESVGLTHRLKHKPRELSGGEMQRAAIARALVTQPDLLLADEPTGNLDQATGEEILGILRGLNRRQNLTIVMVTHDQTIAEQADRTVCLADGRIVG